MNSIFLKVSLALAALSLSMTVQADGPSCEEILSSSSGSNATAAGNIENVISVSEALESAIVRQSLVEVPAHMAVGGSFTRTISKVAQKLPQTGDQTAHTEFIRGLNQLKDLASQISKNNLPKGVSQETAWQMLINQMRVMMALDQTPGCEMKYDAKSKAYSCDIKSQKNAQKMTLHKTTQGLAQLSARELMTLQSAYYTFARPHLLQAYLNPDLAKRPLALKRILEEMAIKLRQTTSPLKAFHDSVQAWQGLLKAKKPGHLAASMSTVELALLLNMHCD